MLDLIWASTSTVDMLTEALLRLLHQFRLDPNLPEDDFRPGDIHADLVLVVALALLHHLHVCGMGSPRGCPIACSVESRDARWAPLLSSKISGRAQCGGARAPLGTVVQANISDYHSTLVVI
mmetsp:Transcript_101330/g.325636  ORF Transcript_101330/g.325636 Transcript_101330/m.325636 type:complete len:122 (-) Transcript_101330:9-374(-)